MSEDSSTLSLSAEELLELIRTWDQSTFDRAIHATARGQLDNCREHYYASEFGQTYDEPDRSFAPYDDCDDCIVREVILSVFPVIETWVREQYRLEMVASVNAFLDGRGADPDPRQAGE